MEHPIPSQFKLTTIVGGLDHPDSACWDPTSGNLFAGGELGQVYRFTMTQGSAELVTTAEGGFILGLAVDGDSNLYAADTSLNCVYRISPAGARDVYAQNIARPQHPAFGPDGRLWVAEPGAWGSESGHIAAILQDGSAKRLDLPPLAFPTGIVVVDGSLFVLETGECRLVQIPIAGGKPVVVGKLGRCFANGLALDANGDFWVSCWSPNWLIRVSPSGRVELVIDDWTGEYLITPTSVAFAGPQLDRAIFGSLGGSSVTALDLGVRGAPLEYPHLPS